MYKYKQAMLIGDNIADVMKLPCVMGCVKAKDSGELLYLLCLRDDDGENMFVTKGYWLVEDVCGHWTVMSDEMWECRRGDVL